MNYTMAIGPGLHGQEEITDLSVFERWVGETVPMRGPNHELIGEATITAVYRSSGSNLVYVTIEAEHDPGCPGIRSVAEIVTGRSPMNFSVKPEDVVIPHQPKRDDDVARWLKRLRDQGVFGDEPLDEYRARADYGLTLDDDLSELPGGY